MKIRVRGDSPTIEADHFIRLAVGNLVFHVAILAAEPDVVEVYIPREFKENSDGPKTD